MIQLVAVIGAVLISSGFFSCAEAALLSITEADIETMRRKNRFGTAKLIAIQEHLDRAVFAIVIMNNIANIVGSILVGQIVSAKYGSSTLAITTTALTFGVIVFSEIIPKSIGIHYCDRISRYVAFPIWLLSKLLFPFIIVLVYITKHLKKGERKVGTEEQIRSLVNLGRQSGHIETDEVQLIHRAFILNDKTARDVMTDLKDLNVVHHADLAGDAWEKIRTITHSRFPVVGDSIHDIVGILHKADVLETIALGQNEKPITDFMREALVVEASMHADNLLVTFRDKHIHLAVVQEESHTIGLVTLEDVLEELVGDIEDETDIED